MMQRTRVVHVSGCLDVGGQEKLLVEFARHADRDRFDLHFVALSGRGPIADELEALGWPVTPLAIGAGLHLRLPLRLAKLLRYLRTDVVHTHNDRPLLYAAPAARLARVGRVIHSKHGRGSANSGRQNLLAALTARLVDRFVCVSDDCARQAIQQGVPSKRIVALHNGIDVERFASAGPKLEGPAVVVARLCPDKDLATLLEAAAIVCRTAPEFRLRIAGDGSCAGALRQLAEQLGIAQRVEFLGAVRDVPALLKQARMSVLSSISEGVPLTLLEAMASGLPVVATRVGGIPEIIADGVTGLLVPPRNPELLAAALVRLQGDDELALRIGAAGRRHVRERFDVRDMVQRYESLYSQSSQVRPRGIAAEDSRRMHPCASRT